MSVATPLTARPDVYSSRRFSVFVPADDDAIAERDEPDQKLALSLQQSWQKAAERFYDETHENLGSSTKITKDSVLATLKQQYGADSKEAKKRDELMGIVGSILNGVELVAAVTAQAAGLVFGHADMCFNALTILFSIPRAVQKNAETLQALFTEVSTYLNNFRIYDRIDRSGMLDIALLTSNNEILITLVDLVILAWKAMNHTFKVVSKFLFLKSDDVADCLAKFKGLIDRQNQLTTTITLEAVLKNESKLRQLRQSTKLIDDVGKDTNRIVRDLASDNAENKNERIVRERILKINKALELNEALTTADLDRLSSIRPNLREDTITLLKDNLSYQDWCEDHAISCLYINGSISSGKTPLLGALAWKIENQRILLRAQQKQDRKTKSYNDDRSIYLTYYSFAKLGKSNKSNKSNKFNSPLHSALKTIAAQLAAQDARYAKFLKQKLDASSDTPLSQLTVQDLWKMLRLVDFEAPPNSLFYIFLDDLDQHKDSVSELVELLNPYASPDPKPEKLKLKVILTGNPSSWTKLDVTFLRFIDMKDINNSLIRKFIANEMENRKIFEDDEDNDSTIRRNQVLDTISSSSDGSFAIAAKKLSVLQQEIEEDADFEEVLAKLEITTISTLADEGDTILCRLGEELSEQHKKQLKEILIWCIHGAQTTITVLEAALYLQRDKKSLEPLKKKIERRFEDAIEISGVSVSARSSVVEAIESSPDYYFDQTLDESQPNEKGVINISIDALDETALKKFAADLDKRISSGDFQLLPKPEKLKSSQQLMFNSRTAQYTILSRLLRALNDDRIQRQTVPLVIYAAENLPVHVYMYSFMAQPESLHSQSNPTSNDQMRIVGKGLINFLCDPESISYTWKLRPLKPEVWLVGDYVNAIGSILKDDALYAQLDPIERRWVTKYARNLETILFYTEIMKTVANKWLADLSYRDHAQECFEFIDRYLSLLTTTKSDNTTYEGIALVRTESLGPEVDFNAANQLNSGMTLDADINKIDAAVALNSEHANGQVISPEAVPEIGQTWLTNDSEEMVNRSAGAVKFDIGTGNNGQSFASDLKDASFSGDREKRVPLLGSFSKSSKDMYLWNTSVLKASCANLDGNYVVSQLDLNSCLGIQSGVLQWQNDGNAFRDAKSARLSTDGKWIQLLLIDGESRENLQTIRLDERIGNIDGTLTVVDGVTTSEGGINPKSDQDDTDLEGQEVEFRSSHLERVERAAEWALGVLKREMDWFALIRVGDTLVYDEPDAASQYLHRSQPPKDDIYKETTLSLAQATMKDYRGAIQSLESVQQTIKQHNPNQPAMSSSEAKPRLDYEDNARVVDLFSCLTRTADYYNLIGSVSKAIDLMEEALVLRPWACACRWRLICFLCGIGQSQRAKELFCNWDQGEASALQSSSSFLEQLVNYDALNNMLMPIVYACRRTDFYKDIGRALEEAIVIKKSSKHDSIKCDLLYVHGLTYAINRESEALEVAEKSWKEAFRIGRHMGGDSVEWSAKLTCMCFFDQTKKGFESLRDPTIEEINALMEEFTELISQYEMPPQLSETFAGWRITGYVACLGRITGQIEKSRDVLRSDVADAINVLSDDDVSNDEQGVTLLIHAFARLGDMDGIFNALSLLDRTVLRARLMAKAEAKAKAEAEGTISVCSSRIQKDKPEKKLPGSGENSNGLVTSQQQQEIEVTKTLIFTCDHCEAQSYTWEEKKEIWMCQYCPDVSFCSSCHDMLLNGTLPRFICNPEHEFVLLKHPEYEPYEIEGDNVRIGWQWETVEVDGTGEDGEGKKIKKEIRTGGKMVSLPAWLDLLKKDWNITETKKIEGTVQQ